MRKTDKKIDNALRVVLTQVCDIALEQYEGFAWLTHIANYQDFPRSLLIVCVFDTHQQQLNANKESLRLLIKQKLATIDIQLKDIPRQIRFDDEESCQNHNQGKWQERLQ